VPEEQVEQNNKVSESDGGDPFYKEPSIQRWRKNEEETKVADKHEFSAAIEINDI
jgi:hypothetical protein